MSDDNRSETQGRSREANLKEARSEEDDRRNTNRQRGRVRATSMLGNAKSDSHRKTYQVEPDGPSRKFWHLTRGDLGGESCREVSRGHKSEEAAVMVVEQRAEGPKTPTDAFRVSAGSTLKPTDAATTAAIRRANGHGGVESPSRTTRRVPVNAWSGTGEETCRPSH